MATLLRLAGYDVKPETLIGHKKVDIYAEERRWGKTRRVAVECKLYNRPITQKQITEIYANYRPLYDGSLIDEVLLVTMRGVAPSASALIDAARGFAHVTLDDLQNSVIDFTTYLQGLTRQVEEDGLAKYYVKPQLPGDVDLENLVKSRISLSSKPIAILGSYGMGKTSFARHYAAELAKAALSDPAARIPVLIRLVEISAEQSLEGLLGRVLGSGRHVRNYSFEAFMDLNARGRFIVFLDGFDEMKHALTWDQFRYNFKELNRLVTGDSRVVLLGRPTAFLSDAEQQYVLHGLRRAAEGGTREQGWPDYEEIQLQPFSRAQVREFLVGYTNYRVSEAQIPITDPDDVLRRIDTLDPRKLSDLAARPVQLRILSEVLPQWRGDVSELTLAILYSLFINMVIEREQEKLTRRRFDVRERRDFARRLAFWLWLTPAAAMSVDASRIPAELFPAPKGDDSHDGVRRDMISACFLDRKFGGALFFPHRSFQEFLVAEHIVLNVRQSYIDIRMLSVAVRPEIAEFVTQIAEPDDFEKFNGELRRFAGNVSLPLLQGWMRNRAFAQTVVRHLRKFDTNPWAIVQAAISVQSNADAITPKELLRLFARRATSFQPRSRLAALLSSMAIMDTFADRSTLDEFVSFLFQMAEAAFEDFVENRHLARSRNNIGTMFAQSDFIEASVLRAIVVTKSSDGTTAVVDLRKAFLILVNELRNEALVEEWADEAKAAQAENLSRMQLKVAAVRLMKRRAFRQSVTFADIVAARLNAST